MSDLTARPQRHGFETAEPTVPTDRDLVFTALVSSPTAQRDEPQPTTSTAAPVRPTVRWGALVWSLVFAGLASLSLWFMIDRPARRSAAEWFGSLDAFTAGLYALASLGALIAIFSIVGLLRRGERARR